MFEHHVFVREPTAHFSTDCIRSAAMSGSIRMRGAAEVPFDFPVPLALAFTLALQSALFPLVCVCSAYVFHLAASCGGDRSGKSQRSPFAQAPCLKAMPCLTSGAFVFHSSVLFTRLAAEERLSDEYPSRTADGCKRILHNSVYDITVCWVLQPSP